MHPTPTNALIALWLGWLISWIVAARLTGGGDAQRREGLAEQLRYRAPMVAGAALLIGALRWRALPLWQPGPALAWSLVGGIALGIAFAWWARVHLGRLWSASITVQEEHRVVDTGPYGWVRHPIYTGLGASLIATAALLGTALALAGAALVWLAFALKARREERLLREALGAEAYDAYAARVPMLIPGLRRP